VAAARPARLDDCSRLAELWGAAQEELRPQRGGWLLVASSARARAPAASFREQLADPARHLVVGVGQDGRVVGYGSCRARTLADGQRVGSLEELYVEPAARRQGVGRAIAAQLVDWCCQQGCCGLDGLALPGNRAAKSFFEAAGFTARLLVMHRRLDEQGQRCRPRP